MTTDRNLRLVSLAVVLVACFVFALLTPARSNETFVDQAIYRETVVRMWHGDGYYAAMDTALRNYNGPASSWRAFRLPTPFLVWRLLPTPTLLWFGFVAMVAAVGVLMLRFTTSPVVVPLVVIYLLRAGRPFVDHVWFDQFLVVELWVVLPVTALLWARDRRSWWWAATFGALAILTRELAVGVVLSMLLAARWYRRPTRPWVVALVTAAAGLAVHVQLTRSHLVANGHEIALLGTARIPETVTGMMGVLLPRGHVLGPIIWLLALGRLVRDPELGVSASGLMIVPALGFWVGRDYWGFMVVPFTILWAGEFLSDVLRGAAGRVRAVHGRTHVQTAVEPVP